MVILTSIRQSPAYLYAKAYCLCALVTIFQAAPVSSRLPRAGESLHLKKYRLIRTRLGPRIVPVDRHEARSENSNAPSHLVISEELVGPWAAQAGPLKIVRRWWRRLVDLAQVKKLLRRDLADSRVYPELEWDATVRRSSSIHPDEERFVAARRRWISSEGHDSLSRLLGLPADAHVDPRDVPLIAFAGSGGGYRAMYGFAAFLSTAKKLGLWDCAMWTAGVSGSCWTLAAYYTIARHDFARLTRHYLAMAREQAHPLSVYALDMVARSGRGVYFLIGPLVRKAQSGIIGLGVMDLYATLTTAYQFLSREEPKTGLSRASFQFSKVWRRAGIDRGMEPMPILTAVRRAPRNSSGVKPHSDSSISKGQPPSRALTQHQTAVTKAMASHRHREHSGPEQEASGFFQWFEISPLEVGSPDVNAYIPTWSWGRTFVSGRSVGRRPEQSLALLLGQCTSAPAGPLTGYISALLASLPRGTVMSRILLLLNDFARMKRWERLWGNPIRSGHDPNPFYGLNTRTDSASGEQNRFRPVPTPPSELEQSQMVEAVASGLGRQADDDEAAGRSSPPVPWEFQGRIRLMDSGMSNNLPNHVLARPERSADIIIAFDASSDVQRGSAMARIQNFADDCHIRLENQTATFDAPCPRFQGQSETAGQDNKAAEIEATFLSQYARVFRGEREDGREMYVVYCPLLPNGANPGFDPSTAAFSTSYNLVWTPGQVRTLFATTEANLSLYAVGVIKQVVRRVYLSNRARRLAA